VSAQVPRDWTPAGVRKMETIRNEFASLPQVSEVCLSYEIPNGMNGAQPSIYKNGSDSTTAIASQGMVTDFNYLNTYQIPLKSGSFFRSNETDSSKIVLNEKAVQALGWSNVEEAIGQQIKTTGNPIVFTIQGVTNNFHFTTMKEKIEPIIFFQPRLVNAYRFLSFKLKPGNIGSSIDAIQRKWAVLLPGSSFEYSFMDDSLKKLYSSELQLKKASHAATVLALIIALLGVLGLLSLSIQKRTKEIGIRKVLGASASGIIGLFLKEFLPVLIIGGIISVPIAWNVLGSWLDNYAYRIKLDWVPFVIPVVVLGVITTIVIVLKILRAAALNPVKSLRIE
jgi:putative ABC transport system permease protein